MATRTTTQHGRRFATRLRGRFGAMAACVTVLASSAVGVNLAPIADATMAPPPNQIVTFAGNSLSIPVAPGNLHSQPGDVAVDSAGNVYFSDTTRNVVRRLSADHASVTVFAGTGTPGFGGDGSPANVALLNGPTGVAVDAAGDVFISDTGNKRVRKVDTAGVITTVAGASTAGSVGDGGPATDASLSDPAGLAVDAAGDVFIADAADNRVRKVDTSGVITTVAGTGYSGFAGDSGPAVEARLRSPSGVAVDAVGDLFIADVLNNRVRKVDTSGTITTIAGAELSGSAGDGGPASVALLAAPYDVTFDASGDLFVVDADNDRVRKIDTDGIITTVAGSDNFVELGDGGPASSAQLNEPRGVAVDSAGDLFIADTYHDRVREVDTSNVISTIAGGGTDPGLSKYGGDQGQASVAQLDRPTDVAVDAAGDVFIADTFNNRVRKVDATGVITTIAGSGVEGFAGDDGPASIALLDKPSGVTVDSAGEVFIADSGNGRVRKVDSTGVITTIAGGASTGVGDNGPATAAHLSHPVGVAVDASGDVFIADPFDNRVRKVDSAGVITTIAGTGTGGTAGDGGPASSADLYYPNDVAVDASGEVFIADLYNNRVRKVDTSGVITTLAGSGAAGFSGDGGPATDAQLNRPESVAVGATGDVFITDTGNARVRAVDSTEVITTIAGTGRLGLSGDGALATAAQLQGPNGLAVDGAGDVFVADTYNSRVREIGAKVMTDAPTGVAATALSGAASVSWNAPTHAGGSTILGYVVTAQPGGSHCQTSGQRSCVVTGLTNGVGYTFTVAAENTIGLSAPSMPSATVTPAQQADIWGVVTQADSATSMANVCVTLWGGNAQLRSTCTANDGSFSMANVAPGNYTMSYVDTNGLHDTVWFGGVATQATSTPVVVTSNSQFDASQSMAPMPGSISGTVHFPAEDPSHHACAYLYAPGAGSYQGIGTCTNSAGSYLLSNVPAGTYVVAFTDPLGLAPTVWSGGVDDQATATTITLANNVDSATGVDATPTPQEETIGGVITDPGGAPLANVCLYAFNWTSGRVGEAISATCTNSEGAYVLDTWTPSGRSQIAVVDPTGTYPTRWITSTGGRYVLGSRPLEATAFTVPDNGAFASSLALSDPESISGTVALSGTPLQGACAFAYFADDGVFTGLAATTDASGHYSITGLAPTEPAFGAGYKVAFSPTCGNGRSSLTVWNGAATNFVAASPIVVVDGSPVTGVDAAF